MHHHHKPCCLDALGASPPSVAFFSALGFLLTAKFAFSTLKVFYNLYIRGGVDVKKFGAGEGAWAVITGASDGIGREFALQLAQKKFNVLLISRTESKLNALAKEIEEKSQVSTRVVPMNFSSSHLSFEKLDKVLGQVGSVGVLVNNVGANHDFPIPFVEESESVITSIVNVNITNTMLITKLIAPKMIVNGKGLILNIGSFAGMIPQPFLSVYSASKSFLATWSQALGKELEKAGVMVEHVNTYFVVSAMSKIRKPNFTTPLPKPYVKSVLAKIGNPGGARTPFTSSVFPSHGILNFIVESLMSRAFWVNKAFAIQSSIRRRALKKQERLQNESKK